MAFQVNAQTPVASFTSDLQEGCSPLAVQFVNQSEGDDLNYLWDFGNGNTSILENPQASYTEYGNYTVSLTVWNDDGEDSMVIESYISVYDLPDINFHSASATEGCPPFDVEFIPDIENFPHNDLSFNWDFGTGAIAHDSLAEYTYGEAGTYDVLLTVYDSHGCFNSIYKGDYITVYENPIFSISASNQTFCNEPSTVDFSIDVANMDDYTVEWDFGDGTSATGSSPSHTYNSYGDYSLTVTVTSPDGCERSEEYPDYISITPITADFTPHDTIVCSGTPVAFQNLSSGYSDVSWDFGDGTTSGAINPVHVFVTSGSFDVSLEVSNDEGCEKNITYPITVESVTADFSIETEYVCQLPATINYYDNSTNAVSWEWYMGNGMTYTDQNPVNTYEEGMMPGDNPNSFQFTDTLIVTSPNGCTDMHVVSNGVNVTLPNAYFIPNNSANYATQMRGCAPLEIDFMAGSTYDTDLDDIISRTWDFGDGTTSTLANPTHVWNNPGEYDISLTVVTEMGCEDTYTAHVEVGTQQTADFTHSMPDTMCASEYAHFEDLSTDEDLIDQWIWSFSDGGTSIHPNAIHQFSDTGWMDVGLMVGYNGCYSEPIVEENAVYIEGPLGSFTFDFDCSEPLTYTVTAFLTDAETWHWDMGDGYVGFDNQETVTYTFAEEGNYQIKLVADNSETECEFEYHRTVKPRIIEAYMSIDTAYGCPGLAVTADGSESINVLPTVHGGSWGKYRWTIDEQIDTVNNENYTHYFYEPGEHSLRMIVKDRNGCADTVIKHIMIYQPQVDIADLGLTEGCAPMSIDFSATSVSDTTITSWEWNFGDGNTAFGNEVTHMYLYNGVYYPSLHVTDALGCSNTIMLEDTIRPSRPSANFLADDINACEGQAIVFNSEENDPECEYQWSFGNGDSSSDMTGSTVFDEAGYYNVSLTVTDDHGCYNYMTKENYIHVQPIPLAIFESDSTMASCYPFEVSFTDLTQSDYLSAWEWNFGDGSNNSALQDPVHNYLIPGDYDVSLVVTTSYGCSDTIVIENMVNVGGPYAEMVVPDTVCPGIEFTLSIENGQNIYQTNWDLGDGNFASGETVQYSYDNHGYIYPTVMLASDSIHTCDKAFRDSVYVPNVLAAFNIPEYNSCANEFVEFDNESEDANTFEWNFGDGNTDNSENPSHIYGTDGAFDVSLIATNQVSTEMACSDTAYQTVEVYPIPHTDFSFTPEGNPHDCTLPEKYNFTNLTEGATGYLWDFEFTNNPGSATSTEEHPSHMYMSAASYDVQLISQNEYGCTDTLVQNLTVYPGLKVAFDIEDLEGCAPMAMDFENVSCSLWPEEDPIASYSWDFGNGVTATDANPTVTLSNGTHSIILAAETESGCRDTVFKENIIKLHESPTADFSIVANDDMMTPQNYGLVEFYNESDMGDAPLHFYWEFGDGTSSEETQPTHRYSSNEVYVGDSYYATLIAKDDNGCTDTVTYPIGLDYFSGLYIPNAMLVEKGLGEQCLFKPKGKSLRKYHMEIYDRFGNKLFETTELNEADGSPTEAWDGRFQGQLVPEGVYVWKIEAEFADGTEWHHITKSGKKTNTGTITVIH